MVRCQWKFALAGILMAVFYYAVTSPSAHAEPIASETFDDLQGDLSKARSGTGWAASAGWKTATADTQDLADEILTYAVADGHTLGGSTSVSVHGSAQRNNPLRRQLEAPFADNELFVRFLLRYRAASIDTVAGGGDGEFFVLWLDDIDGGDGADHNLEIPNIGLSVRTAHGRAVGDKKNLFMVRIGNENSAFSPVELIGDHTYLLVARAVKTQPGPTGVFDRLELWVDPKPGDFARKPDAIAHGRGSNTIGWVGFGTGKRTEKDDFIFIDELALGRRWSDVVPGADPSAVVPLPAPVKAKVEIAPATPTIPPERLVDFRRDVYPILRDRCFACHQGADADSGHRLDQYDEIVGLNQGKALAIAKDGANSPLYQVLVEKDKERRMPQGEDPLPAREIAILKNWIDQGLAWDEGLLPTVPLRTDHPLFQPIKRPAVPRVVHSEPRASASEASVTANPIDAFVTEKHAEQGLKFSQRADRRTLLRRLTLDLTGLPPTPEELAAFLADDSPAALRQVIDRLLSSTAYGERWGRHWLDVARWAESDGYQQNFKRNHAWRYRDYVVNSFAKNKPYDEFLRQQIAGDELSPYTDENIIATGFLAAARYSGNELDQAIQRQDILIDITNTTTSAVLGLTMQCAQCHNHKFDPLTARDYFQFLGFFVKGQPLDAVFSARDGNPLPAAEQADLAAASDELNEMLFASRTRFESNARKRGVTPSTTQNAVVGGLSPEQKERLNAIKKQMADLDRAWVFYSPATSPHRLVVPFQEKTAPLAYSPEFLQQLKPILLYRGDLDSPGPEVSIGWPAVFGPAPARNAIANRPRTALVDWLTDRNNPLTARVWVNRIWQSHFGQGLVTTPDDFGTQGAEPSHSELLDWLAAELIESDWNTGHIQRLILESNTYQQSSQFNEALNTIDPENRYLWRWLPRRLEAEAIRDSMLLVSGLLNDTVGGPCVPLKERDSSNRRTIYLEQKRGELPYVQVLFDAPSTLMCCGRRRNSTVPLQPLFLLNNPETVRYSEALATRIVQSSGPAAAEQVTRAFELVLGRSPSDDEQKTMTEFLADHAARAAGEQSKPHAGLVQLCQGLMNLNEFLYLP